MQVKLVVAKFNVFISNIPTHPSTRGYKSRAILRWDEPGSRDTSPGVSRRAEEILDVSGYRERPDVPKITRADRVASPAIPRRSTRAFTRY